MNDEMNEVLTDVMNGSAICFLGAGFSLGAVDGFKKRIPSTEELTQEIRNLAGIAKSEGGSLSDLAEYCETDDRLQSELISLLQDRMTNCTPTEIQIDILSLPWRAIFTTNFDDVAESAMGSEKRQVVTPRSPVDHIIPGKVPLYYLHGRALDVASGERNPKLVLSETNYIDLAEENRDLYSTLENEIAAAKRVVFLGYSIRDAEIASRLFRLEGIARRAVVITRPDSSRLQKVRLQKFGKVFEIGIEGFRTASNIARKRYDQGQDTKSLGFANRVTAQASKNEVAVEHIEKLLLTGQFDYGAYTKQINSPDGINLYCVRRTKSIKKIFDTKSLVNRFVVTSDLGNGKTIFCEQVAHEGLERGFDVIKIDTNLQELIGDLDRLLATGTKKIFIVDDYARYHKFANYIGARISGNSKLVVTLRQDLDAVGFAQISKNLKGTVREIDINVLNEAELSEWNEYLERWGFWGDKIKEDDPYRLLHLKNRCGSENRSIVVSIFENSSIAKKIRDIVQYFVNTNPEVNKAFVAILINALCQNHVQWSRIVDWLQIDEAEFKLAVLGSPISGLMTGSRHWYELSSNTLADFILNNFELDVNLVVQVYTDIVRQTAYSSTDKRSGYDAVENLKELMRFRFLTRLFTSNDDAESIISAVYQRLSSVPKIRKHDQFWLQYAMARMEVGDLDAAERYLKTAIGVAEKNGGGYGLRQIYDQRVRLIFRKFSMPGSKIENSQIYTALDDVSAALKATNEYVIYPLRSAHHISDFLDRQIDKMDLTLRKRVEGLVDEMSEIVKNLPRLERSQRGETQRIKSSIRSCKLILTNA